MIHEHAWLILMNNRTIKYLLQFTFVISLAGTPLFPSGPVYEIWEPQPAPNRGGDNSGAVVAGGYPYDEDWEKWSYPIGNGYMGANVFGRVDAERVQLTEKTLYNSGLWNLGSLTNFAEILIHFDHGDITNYRRSLNLNEAIVHVSYGSDGVKYDREYFMSYPANVLVIRLSADQKGKVSFTLAPEIPYRKSREEANRRTGTVVASGDHLILSGTVPHFSLNFEAQCKVINEGGTLSSTPNEGGEQITVSGADTATILVAAGTNYVLGDEVFKSPAPEKTNPLVFPHEQVSATIDQAANKGFEALKREHLADYQNLFGRVKLRLDSKVSNLSTSALLEHYKAGGRDTYLEELMFHHGRYLLIASSREKSLPAGLQGAWSQYEVSPWTGGYWHNINVQMNYWGALSTNLPETFEAYLKYFEAFLPKAKEHATSYLQEHHSEAASPDLEENGWIIGTGASPYEIHGAGGHSGPGTGGFTSKLFMEYFHYTQDETFLRETGYPVLRGMSRFLSKTLVQGEDGLLLVHPSASPEQKVTAGQVVGMPGQRDELKGYYITKGCTFDQGFVWENHQDVLQAADVLEIEDPLLELIREQLPRLDPILIGESGQIKEYREEEAYGELGEIQHRHISHLCPLYPGTLINATNPAWMKAASVTLDLRGDVTTGWAMAHRMNCRARLKEAEKAHAIYQKFIELKTVPNLWTLHPPFQIDGNFGMMAGVAEMLLQSHEGDIELLPALPKAWENGSFEGLVARGNFVIATDWKDGIATSAEIVSRSGKMCRISYPGIEEAIIMDQEGQVPDDLVKIPGTVSFPSRKGATYTVKMQTVSSQGANPAKE
jgi:alpha-L-fucosidase 2